MCLDFCVWACLSIRVRRPFMVRISVSMWFSVPVCLCAFVVVCVCVCLIAVALLLSYSGCRMLTTFVTLHVFSLRRHGVASLQLVSHDVTSFHITSRDGQIMSDDVT